MRGAVCADRYPECPSSCSRSRSPDALASTQVVMVRDSKDRQGATLSFTADRWTGFVQGSGRAPSTPEASAAKILEAKGPSGGRLLPRSARRRRRRRS
ncbi:DUF397 domain-containing protein [Micromonospora sediminicola]|uniref:DUF397 domain-containing protein n=1 Tax=Micromonospora sediminicola TaxID=946078 RepID=UPI00378BF40A